MLYALRIIAVLSAALALIPAGAHLFSLLNKLRLRERMMAGICSQSSWSLASHQRLLLPLLYIVAVNN